MSLWSTFLITDTALLSSIAAFNSATLTDSLHHDMMSPLRWVTSLFPGSAGGVEGGSWWRPGDLGMSSAAVFSAGRR